MKRLLPAVLLLLCLPLASCGTQPATAAAPDDLDRIADSLEEIQRELARIRRTLERR